MECLELLVSPIQVGTGCKNKSKRMEIDVKHSNSTGCTNDKKRPRQLRCHLPDEWSDVDQPVERSTHHRVQPSTDRLRKSHKPCLAEIGSILDLSGT